MSHTRTLILAFAFAVAVFLALTYTLGLDTLSSDDSLRRIILPAAIGIMTLLLLLRAGPLLSEDCPEPPLSASPRLPLLLAVGVLVGALLIGTIPLQSIPLSGDEGAYVLQAQMLAEGRVSMDLTPVQPYVAQYYIFPVQDRLISQYPPGWPAVLAIFSTFRLPLVLANPLIGAASVLALWHLGSRIYGPQCGTLAAALMALSAFCLFNAASFYNHAFIALCGILFVSTFIRFLDRPSVTAAIGTGIFFSAIAATRHLDALLLALPAALVLLRRARLPHWRLIPLAAAAALPLLALTLCYYRAATGAWLVIPQTLRDPDDGLLGAYWSASLANSVLVNRFIELAEWVSPGFLALLIVALIAKLRTRTLRFHDLYAPLFFAGYWLYWSDGGHRWGPRYVYAAFPFMALTIASWACAASQRGRPHIRLALMACLIAAAFQVVPLAFRARQLMAQTQELRDAVARAGLHNAIVMIGTWTGQIWLIAPGDLARNGLRLDGDVIYAHAPGLNIGRSRPPGLDEAAAAMQTHFPQRSVWLYVRDTGDEKGHLQKWK